MSSELLRITNDNFFMFHTIFDNRFKIFVIFEKVYFKNLDKICEFFSLSRVLVNP